MEKTTPLFLLIIMLFINQNLYAEASGSENLYIEFGEKYEITNCLERKTLDISISLDNLADDLQYYNWHTFHTPKERKVIELNLTNLDLGEQSSVAILDVFKSSIIWSTSDLSQASDISTEFINLDTDSPYYILVSSTEASNGSYLLELNIGAPNPVNDLCEGAVDLGNLTCGDFMYFEADPSATPDPEATGNCIDNTTPAQWYTFTTSDPLEFGSMYNNNLLADIELFKTTSGCDGLVYVDCYNGTPGTNYGFDFEPGTTYYFLVSGDFFYSIPWDYDSTCDNPIWDGSWWWWWEDQIEFWSSTDCAESSNLVPCENDHVVWYEFTTDCVESDVLIEVSDEIYEDWWWGNGTAEEISITIIADDCTTILSDYDVNGTGFVCSALGNSESISLEGLPPNFTFLVAFGSSFNNLGHFGVTMTSNSDGGEVLNDICSDVEILQNGENLNLSNLCATFNGAPFDALIPGCPGQSEATVWYEFDPGVETQDITVNLGSQSINDPAIAVYDGCIGSILESICGNSLELNCIEEPILIEVGSSTLDAGTFDLEIITTPSPPPLAPEIMGNDICSGDETDIQIEIPGGALVDINVTVGPGSSPLVTGYMNQSFNSASSVSINQELVNTSTTVQEVIYVVSLSPPAGVCTTEDVEISIMVNPGFEVAPLTVEECLPHILNLNVSELITGGSPPYTSVSWFWNGAELISSLEDLSYNLLENGQIVLEVIDNAGCTESAEITIDLLDIITPTFDFPLSYCRPEQDYIVLPDVSMEGIEGTWTTALIDLSEFTENGFFDLTFTPDESYCSFPIIATIEIIGGEEPVFDLPDIICAEDDFFVFPTEDLNGVEGTWDNPFIDLATAVGVQYNTFTPFASQECLTNFEYIFEVGTDIELDFGQPDQLCRSDAPIVLSNTSLSGFEGTWDIPTIDPAQVIGDEFTATWTPFDGQSPCIASTTIIVSIVDPSTAEFMLPTEICSIEDIYVFPTMDTQGINGSWSIDTIDPGELNGIVESVFTADDGCVLAYSWDIEIVEPVVPEFDLETEFCVLDELFNLPTTSDNGIQGSWSQASIDPTMYSGEELTIEFLGNPDGPCVKPVSFTFSVSEAMNPTFDLPAKLCWEDEDLLLPTISNNSISGSWDPAIIDIQSGLGSTVSSTFTADDGSCTNEATIAIELLAPYDVLAITTDPTGCVEEDGSIEIEVLQGDNLEFSLDNGLTWQTDNIFTSLGSGGYTVLVRALDFTACELAIETFLNSNDGPIITEIQSEDISSCTVENGSILVDAEGDNLEYSIDAGLSWQVSNEFTDLPAGTYMISIREAMSDCIIETSAEISDFPITEIMVVNSQEVTDCNVEDGQIEILATGEALEYSIDDGTTWSLNNNFTGLPSGIYMIQVRSTIGDDCLDTDMVELINPDEPSLISWDAQNPTVCQPATGSLLVEANGNDLEYSLDGGSTWQEENLFMDIPAGSYTLIIREREKINCTDEALVEIVNDSEVLSESTIAVTIPSDCEIEDGSLTITNSEIDLEYSIDGGVIWQQDSEFNNLASGSYQVITRKILIPDCYVEQLIDIPEPDCPCAELLLEFTKDNLSCSGDAVSTIELVSVEGVSNPDFNILWEDGTEGQLNENVGSGWQYFMIEYNGYCNWMDSVYVEVLDPIIYEWNTKDLDCPEVNNGMLEIVNIEGGSGSYSYALDGQNYQSENIFTALEEGSYQIYVRDDTDCLTVNEFVISSKEEIEISLPEIITIDEGEYTVLEPGVDASQIDYFIWTDGKGYENDSDLNLKISPSENTIYTIEIFYGDCSEIKKVNVELNDKTGIFVSNAFSPNGDGINDHFFIQGGKNSSIDLDEFIILDRWGNVMFYLSDPSFNNAADGWDGLYQGTRVNQGVYIYQIVYSENGQSKILVGTVTILG